MRAALEEIDGTHRIDHARIECAKFIGPRELPHDSRPQSGSPVEESCHARAHPDA